MAIYLLKVNIALILLYGFYRLMTSKDTFFALRRATLWTIYLISLTIPLLNIEYWIKDSDTTVSMANSYATSILPTMMTYANAPSITWDVAAEPFFKSLRKLVNIFKIRMGYGLSGNLGGIDPYNSINLVQPTGVISYNGSPTITMGQFRNANPDLKWETRSTFNIGTDISFWKNRVILTAEYYYSKTRDMAVALIITIPLTALNNIVCYVIVQTAGLMNRSIFFIAGLPGSSIENFYISTLQTWLLYIFILSNIAMLRILKVRN